MRTEINDLGYTKKLCILPFDHRSYFEELLGFNEPLTEEQRAQLSDYKKNWRSPTWMRRMSNENLA